jgi:type III protein arginine methyltransferase
VADDSVLLALLVSSLLPSSDVIAMFPGLRSKGANYLQAIADTNNLSMEHIKVVGKRASSITMDDLKHKKVKAINTLD